MTTNRDRDFEEFCINTAIYTISSAMASTSKNTNSDGMITFRAPSSKRDKILMTFVAC
jgi:hypothetical protein